MHKEKMVKALCLVLILLNACTAKAEPDKVTVQLKWVHQAQFAGFYVAEEMGYFEDENLDVELIEGGPGIDIIHAVTSGEADFAVAAPNELIVEIANGADLKAIATTYQISPIVFVAMADSGISRPQDFVGKKVAALNNSDYELQLRAMMKFLDIDINAIELKEHGYSTEQLASGEIDVHGFYATGGLLRLQNAGYDVNLIYPGDYGVHFNTDALIAADSMLDSRPDVTTRFLRALFRGWHDALQNTDESVQIIMHYALESDPNLQREMLEASIPLISTGDRPIGTMDEASWQAMHDALLDQDIIADPIPLDEILSPTLIDSIEIE